MMQAISQFFSNYPSRRRQLQALTVLVAAVSASACGGGARQDSNSPPPSTSDNQPVTSGGVAGNVTSINGITVPLDPGGAGKASLAGIDANSNGVRDDVERELAAFFGKDPGSYAAALAFARKLQLSFTKPSKTEAEAIESITNELIAFECLVSTLANRDAALVAARMIAARSYNTKSRLAELARTYDLSNLTELPEVGASSCR
jgi:hypothetical protein